MDIPRLLFEGVDVPEGSEILSAELQFYVDNSPGTLPQTDSLTLNIKAQAPSSYGSTDFFTDKLIEYIENGRADGQPFFAFAAYTSPHWPLQVDEKYWRKYEGRYDRGYEVIKRERLESLKNCF